MNRVPGRLMTTPVYSIREIIPSDQKSVAEIVDREWGGDFVAIHGDVFFPHALPGFAAVGEDGEILGLVTCLFGPQQGEIITINSFFPRQGIGTGLIEAVMNRAKQAGIKRLVVFTTNDNQQAIDFYQHRGFKLVAVHQGAVQSARKIKPSIPKTSANGVPIRDELEFELVVE